MNTTEPQSLLDQLIAVIEPRARLLTAYSGGVDSTVVAAAARLALGRANALAAIGDSPSLPRHELDEARRMAAKLDIELIEVRPNEQADPGYRANAGDRCYFCKTNLYDVLGATAKQRGIRFIANGTNADDTGDHRPGLVAAAEHEIVSPLLEAGCGKTQVRQLAEHLGLPNADKPAAACLASRIQYGTEATVERLSMIERAEDVLRELGFRGFRVRHHEAGSTKAALIARIEVPADQLPRLADDAVRRRIVDALSRIGYTYITLDLAGFRSGSGNALLSIRDDSQNG